MTQQKVTANKSEPQIQLIVGLGNPGAQYESTRHNAGAWFVEKLCDRFHTQPNTVSKHHGKLAKITIHGQDCWLLLPTTFMNLSGQAVLSVAQYYKLKPENILVVHDELDLAPGTAKFKFGGGHGGHNGLRDIIQRLGGNKDFYRLRIGIGHPGDRNKVHNFVLGKPSSKEKHLIDETIQCALDAGETLLNARWNDAVQHLHRFKAIS